ncbi:MAG: MGMT family protein [Candidatus Gottesmanbacteria bacterium]
MKANIFLKVYRRVKSIPNGKVMTYGEIGKEIGVDPRIVGFALHANKDINVPCHRVVNKEGRLAPNFVWDGWKEQKRRLLAEGIKFKDETHVIF